MAFPSSLPKQHETLLSEIIKKFSGDNRIVGIGLAGSYATNTMDEYSDLDIIVVATDKDYPAVFEKRFELIHSIGNCVAAFTGEHVGEPRLVITLFEPNAIHVDFKFVALEDAAQRVDDISIVWEVDTLFTDALATEKPHFPPPDPQWIEDRFWIWLHYAAVKIARGEYFETLEMISFLRQNVFGPLALEQSGHTPSGVRRIEKVLPEFAEQLKTTVATTERGSLVKSIENCVKIYLQLRNGEIIKTNAAAEEAATRYFNKLR